MSLLMDDSGKIASDKERTEYYRELEIDKLKQQIQDAEEVIKELNITDWCNAATRYWEKYGQK
jgi:hypothetical protein